MTLREELSGYADRSAALIEDSPQMDEENTKRKIIEPLIDLLGWEMISSDVELEYSVQMGSGTKKVDYALKREGTPVVFVEAKGCDTTLGQRHEDQLKSYMRQVGVDWGLLSNGREFEVFRRDVSSDRPNEISLAAFAVEDVSENVQPLRALARESIDSGESRQIAEKIEAVHDAVGSLRSEKEALAEDVTAVVTDVTGNAVSQHVEDEAKSFVDTLIDTLEAQAHRTADVQEPTGGNGRPIEEGERSADDESEQSTDGAYVIRATRNGTKTYQVGEDLQSEAIGAFVDYLVQEEGLLDAIEIPYVPGTGRGSRALLNDEPEHTNGKEMRTYQEVAGEYYLHTNLPSDQKRTYISQLAGAVGIDCEFVGDW